MGYCNQGHCICAVIEFAEKLRMYIKERMHEPEVKKMTKNVFDKWEETTLPELIDLANSPGREYDNKHELLEQYFILKTDSPILEQKMIIYSANGE